MNNIQSELKKISGFFFLVLLLISCADNAVLDVNKEISDKNWSYIKKIRIPVKIENENQTYNLYLNLRHTADYNYSNIFILIHQSGPAMKPTSERREFRLAYPDGEWLGSGSGNLYSYQMLFRKDYKFPAKGTYIFEFEQNMRDNPLRGISDIGLRVEPSI